MEPADNKQSSEILPQADPSSSSVIEMQFTDGEEPSSRHGAQALPDDHWIVILGDPDHADWSPWSVIADDKDAAIERAIADWFEDIRDEDDEDDHQGGPPEVIKVYRNSWIGRRC